MAPHPKQLLLVMLLPSLVLILSQPDTESRGLWITVCLGIFLLTCVLTRVPASLYKLSLYAKVFQFMLLSKDKKFGRPVLPAGIPPAVELARAAPGQPLGDRFRVTSRRTLLAIRHGESMWNDVFNKGHHRSKAKFLVFWAPRMLWALLTEAWLFLCGARDSWFYDSPASQLGISQSEALDRFLRTDTSGSGHVSVLRGDKLDGTAVVSSNLRRCITTGLVGLQHRFTRAGAGRMLLLPSLQEISKNADTLSITPPRAQPVPSFVDEAYTSSQAANGELRLDLAGNYTRQIDSSQNAGNKSVKSNGLLRLQAFMDWVFGPLNSAETLVVCGHSLWFRYMFQTFLPQELKGFDVAQLARTKKIVNCGVVACDVVQLECTQGPDQGKVVQLIDPASVQVVYGGFE